MTGKAGCPRALLGHRYGSSPAVYFYENKFLRRVIP